MSTLPSLLQNFVKMCARSYYYKESVGGRGKLNTNFTLLLMTGKKYDGPRILQRKRKARRQGTVIHKTITHRTRKMKSNTIKKEEDSLGIEGRIVYQKDQRNGEVG